MSQPTYFSEFLANGRKVELSARNLASMRCIARQLRSWLTVYTIEGLAIGQFDRKGNWHDLAPIVDADDSIELPIDDSDLEFWQPIPDRLSCVNTSIWGG